MDSCWVISVAKNAFDVIRLIHRVDKNLMQLVICIIEKRVNYNRRNAGLREFVLVIQDYRNGCRFKYPSLQSRR